MTSSEMQEAFLIAYDKITNFAAPGYTDEEISIFLTKAQEQFLNSYINPKGDKYGDGFEETEFVRRDLRELVKGATISSFNKIPENYPNGVMVELPDDCLYVISEYIVGTSTDKCLSNSRIRVKPITHDYYEMNIVNPFKKPGAKYVWRLDYQDNRNELVASSSLTITQYVIRYIERLKPIITDNIVLYSEQGPLDCKLDPSTHERIVSIAVRIATGITDPDMYQLKVTEQQLSK